MVAERRGYSGVGIYSKLQPDRVDKPTSTEESRFDIEGRFIADHFQTDHGRFTVLNAYSPKEAGRTGTTVEPTINSTSIGRYSTGQRLRHRCPVLVIGDYNTAYCRTF